MCLKAIDSADLCLLTDVGLASVMKGQTELEVVKLNYFPQLTVKGLSTLCSPVLHTLNLKSTGVTSEGE